MKRLFYILSILLMTIGQVNAQAPHFSPTQSSNLPIDFSSASDVILFLVLPILFIIFSLLAWRNSKKRNL
ncbi:MAG TPA: hypothetical protein VKX30_07460 [Flavobacteriaceae bacterium]|nr:hypothetical protein [Flavobacteriaceae bacterium]